MPAGNLSDMHLAFVSTYDVRPPPRERRVHRRATPGTIPDETDTAGSVEPACPVLRA